MGEPDPEMELHVDFRSAQELSVGFEDANLDETAQLLRLLRGSGLLSVTQMVFIQTAKMLVMVSIGSGGRSEPTVLLA